MIGLTLWRFVAPLLVVLALFGAGYGAGWQNASKRTAAVTAQFNQFKGGVEAAGRDAFRRAEIQTANDLKRKEDADAKDKSRAAASASAIAKLRAERDEARNSSGGFVPPAPAGSVCPEGLICFDRAGYGAARGDFTSGIRHEADEGAKVERELGTAREWARETNR